MARLEFPRSIGGHFYLPVLIYGQTHPIFAPRCLVDTGATKCGMPKVLNEKQLSLPVAGHDEDVGTAKGARGFDFVTVPTISLLELKFKGQQILARETDLQVRNIPTWLCDDEEDFIIGMNFLSEFDIILKKNGPMIVER